MSWSIWSPENGIMCCDHILQSCALCSLFIAENCLKLKTKINDDDDEIAYFTVRWKTRASFVYRTKNSLDES